jgi:probable phosphoglycerate mutase
VSAPGIRIALLRHAPTAWNLARRMQGRTDIPLSPEGRAAAATWRLPDLGADFGPGGVAASGWFSSPLARCRETAELMLRSMGCSMEIPLTVDRRLIERGFGDWEGETLEGLRARHGAEMAAWEAQGWDFRPPGGESPRDVLQRSMELLQEMLQQGRSMVCVTHRSVIRAIHARACGWDMLGRPPEKLAEGCVHLFRLDAAGLEVERLNLPLAAPVTTNRGTADQDTADQDTADQDTADQDAGGA